ncbi:OTU domain-containing protein 1-like [Amphiura filiformis]|uniref:OTU domain-containing protein 1-like n=1 Tax=Amphiura filiformis TaxID=82378 RepID=UPI003B21EF0E
MRDGILSSSCKCNPVLEQPNAYQTRNQHQKRECADLVADVQQDYLFQLRLQRHRIISDGNCLFRSIIFTLYADERLHDILRSSASDFMEEYAGEFAMHFMDQKENTIEELQWLRQDGQWEGEESIITLWHVLNIAIMVTFSNQDGTQASTIQYSFSVAEATIHIAYRGGY